MSPWMFRPLLLADAQERLEQRASPGDGGSAGRWTTPRSFALDYPAADERHLVLYIGSSIGNFEPEEAAQVLRRVRAALRLRRRSAAGRRSGEEPTMLYSPPMTTPQGVTAAFNRNMLVRINRELGADFEPTPSRIARVERLGLADGNASDESASANRAHHRPRHGSRLRRRRDASTPRTATSTGPVRPKTCWRDAGFTPEHDLDGSTRGWFAVCLARAE